MSIIGAKQRTDLLQTGPTVYVGILPSQPILRAIKKEGGEIPPPIEAAALIDTGASCTSIDASIAQGLSLTARDERLVFTPNGKSIQFLYDISLTIPHLGVFDLQALGANLSGQMHKVLIGRDVLVRGTLIYSGWTNSFELCL